MGGLSGDLDVWVEGRAWLMLAAQVGFGEREGCMCSPFGFKTTYLMADTAIWGSLAHLIDARVVVKQEVLEH